MVLVSVVAVMYTKDGHTEPGKRSKRDRIERLRTRIRALSDTDEAVLELRGILMGILDLLEDEL